MSEKKRQIVLDTETTGIDPAAGHRIIEVGCVEMVGRRLTGHNFHYYIQPDREVEAEAIEVHGITNEFLADKPRFHEIAEAFIDYVRGAELIIHNAALDVGFLNHEFQLIGRAERIADLCEVVDTLRMAREMFPGQRASLDALCKRYSIDNAHRTLHGALLDSEILADVYLAMTGGQTKLALDDDQNASGTGRGEPIRRLPADRPRLQVVRATAEERVAHEAALDAIEKDAGGTCLYRRETGEAGAS